MEAGKLKGLAVVSVAEGAKLGYVDELLLDPETLRVAAIRVSGDSQPFVVPFDKIRAIGADAVTVESSQVTQALSTGDSYAVLPSLRDLGRRKVVDEAGSFLGNVTTIDFDEKSGALRGLTVQRGGVLGIGATTTTLEVAMVRAVGRELITVAGQPTQPAAETGEDVAGAERQ
jgi:sporulation protein YlmC with PRC-barrel domain